MRDEPPAGFRTGRQALHTRSWTAAELLRHAEGTDRIAVTLERLVDTTTACAVHLDHTGRLTPRHTELLAELLGELLGELERGREQAASRPRESEHEVCAS
ncbi:hypothetical protein ACH4UM_08805 [Streptomyces sp. NPDC020801]|uniref:hypothetical protein n=1 Tax=unclassified Streptomyces TaxID=2593676 RepID=UPI0037916222